MPVPPPRGILLILLTLSAAPLPAEVVALSSVADTALFEFDGDVNFGRQRTLPAGAIGNMFPANTEKARALFQFSDLAASIPAGATIQSARMKLTVSTQVPENGRVSDFALSRVLVDWGEGDGFGEQPGGRDAMDGEATWNNRFHPDEGWSGPGGVFGVDFANEQSAVAEDVDGSSLMPTRYFFEFNASGIAALQGMLDGTHADFGWVLYSLDETSRRTARRWVSRETISEGPAPELEITYAAVQTVVPVLTSVTIDPMTDELCVRLEGLLGYRYQLQGSGDLQNWTPGEVQVPVADGELVFRLPRDESAKFVRVEASRLP